MTGALVGFTLAFVLTLALISGWKGVGTLREWARRTDERLLFLKKEYDLLMGERERLREYQAHYEGRLSRLMEGFELKKKVAEEEEYDDDAGQYASDAAIASIATRISTLEQTLAAQNLTILDTAERVAHKLQDRRRKRDQIEDEVDHEPDVPLDPAQQLAAAKKALGVADPSQLRLIPDERITA